MSPAGDIVAAVVAVAAFLRHVAPKSKRKGDK